MHAGLGLAVQNQTLWLQLPSVAFGYAKLYVTQKTGRGRDNLKGDGVTA